MTRPPQGGAVSDYSLGMRARAILLALVAVTPFGVLVYAAANERQQEAKIELSTQADGLARLAAIYHRAAIASARELLMATATHWDDSILVTNCEDRLRRISRASPGMSLSVADRNGKLVCSSESGTFAVDFSDRQYFVEAMRSRETAVSNLLRGKLSGNYVVALAHPVVDDSDTKTIRFVLMAELRFDWLPRLLADGGAPSDYEATIIAGSGGTIARFRGHGASKNPNVALTMGEATLPGAVGTQDRIYIGLPMQHADVAGTSLLLRGFGGLAAVTVLTSLVAWFGSGYFVVRPLQRLAKAASQLTEGDLTARTGIPHHNNEIGNLARRLDELAVHRQKVSRALRALSAGNRTLLSEQSEPELLQAMCQVAVDKGGYPLAIVFYAADDEDKSVIPAAHAGDDRGVLTRMRLTYADNERGQGTVATAIRTGRTAVFQDIATAKGAQPWREYLVPQGFTSVASMPLHVDGQVVGTFTLYDSEADAFDHEELELVQEMAEDLAFGIAACRERIRRVDAEREVRRVATHDGLTELYNRSHFIDRLGAALADCRMSGEPLAVVVLHLRSLQALLEGLGYDPAMQVVREIAQRLEASVPAGDCLARVPQDDFVLFRRGADAATAEALARELLLVLESPVRVSGAEIDVQGHIGAAIYPGHGDEPDLLLRRAMLASRNAAKRDAPLALYSGVTAREDPDRLALVAELRRAITAHEMTLHYQPKYDLLAKQVVGSEALLRWRHASRGNVSPAQFIPLAEQTGLIGPMTYMVIESALRQQRAWLDNGLRLPVAVNLSARNLYDPQLQHRVEGLLASWGVPGELLQFEITEGALIDDPQAARKVLEALSTIGCQTYIDDFGTGYSSLNYLISLPVHGLKIDRSFVVRIAAKETLTVVSSIVGMAHGLGMRVVAEGVEHTAERDVLVSLGCDEAQGYLFGRPVPAQEFPAQLRS